MVDDIDEWADIGSTGEAEQAKELEQQEVRRKKEKIENVGVVVGAMTFFAFGLTDVAVGSVGVAVCMTPIGALLGLAAATGVGVAVHGGKSFQMSERDMEKWIERQERAKLNAKYTEKYNEYYN